MDLLCPAVSCCSGLREDLNNGLVHDLFTFASSMLTHSAPWLASIEALTGDPCSGKV